jgi:hypothetical protein
MQVSCQGADNGSKECHKIECTVVVGFAASISNIKTLKHHC